MDRTVRGLLDLFTAPKSQWSKHRLSESFLSAVKKRRSNWNAAWLEKWEVKVYAIASETLRSNSSLAPLSWLILLPSITLSRSRFACRRLS